MNERDTEILTCSQFAAGIVNEYVFSNGILPKNISKAAKEIIVREYSPFLDKATKAPELQESSSLQVQMGNKAGAINKYCKEKGDMYDED